VFRVFEERMMGFEPTTFYMARRMGEATLDDRAVKTRVVL
jgi:hypothetical protein